MTNYFFDCKNDQEIKKKYKELAKKLHPDKGGNEADFKRMKNEYEAALKETSDPYYGGFERSEAGKAWEERQRQTKEYMRQNYNKSSSFYGSQGSTFYGSGTYNYGARNNYGKTNTDYSSYETRQRVLEAEVKRLNIQLECEREAKEDVKRKLTEYIVDNFDMINEIHRLSKILEEGSIIKYIISRFIKRFKR